MPLVVGIDEAGYGPSLGPLVVSATLWRAEPRLLGRDYWELLRTCVARSAARGEWRLTVGDSKAVFDRQRGLCSLERAVLAFAAAAGIPCHTLAELLAALNDQTTPDISDIPWYGDLNRPLPVDRARSAYHGAAEQLRSHMPAAGIVCCGLMTQVVTETMFNQRVARTRNKAAVLVEPVLRLIQRAGQRSAGSDLHVCVDRLGGRCDYRGLLLAAFPERYLHVLDVSADCSRYRLSDSHNDWFIEFCVDADARQLPVALASMLSKYLRELLMDGFNAFWRRWLPSLRPTAGYHTDAQRFLRDIAPVIRTAGVPVEQFVRTR